MIHTTPAAAAAVAADHVKKKVITVSKTVAGDQVEADRWGPLEVTLVVKKTTTILGKKKTVKRTITSLGVPVYPNHTDRSVFINQQALPLLEQEALQAHYSLSGIQLIGGATYTSEAFAQSLQSALLKVKSV